MVFTLTRCFMAESSTTKLYVTKFRIRTYSFSHTHTTGQMQKLLHPCIGYITKGTAEILYCGKTYHVGPGDLFYIAPETRFYSVWHGEPEIEWYSLHFHFPDNRAILDYRFQILHDFPVIYFEKMHHAYPRHFFSAMSTLYSMLDKLYPLLTKNIYHSAYERVAPAIHYIEDHYNLPIRIEYLAELCHYSEPQFFAQFHKATGISPITYKNNICIQYAQDYLANSHRSVEEVSQLLGFSSSSYFRRVFKEFTGKSPREYRKEFMILDSAESI